MNKARARQHRIGLPRPPIVLMSPAGVSLGAPLASEHTAVSPGNTTLHHLKPDANRTIP
jgi:hypothetical protein